MDWRPLRNPFLAYHRTRVYGEARPGIRQAQLLSVDPVSSHGKGAGDIEETQGYRVTYPMIGGPELHVAKLYDMLPADAGNTSEGRTAANNATVRTSS